LPENKVPKSRSPPSERGEQGASAKLKRSDKREKTTTNPQRRPEWVGGRPGSKKKAYSAEKTAKFPGGASRDLATLNEHEGKTPMEKEKVACLWYHQPKALRRNNKKI